MNSSRINLFLYLKKKKFYGVFDGHFNNKNQRSCSLVDINRE